MRSAIRIEDFLAIELDNNKKAYIADDLCIWPSQGASTEQVELRSGKAGSRFRRNIIEFQRADIGDTVMTVTPTTWTRKAAIVSDQDEHVICLVRELLYNSTTIFRSEPSFPCQVSIQFEGRPYYLFAQIVTRRNFSIATSTYSIITGVKEANNLPIWEEVYIGKRYSNRAFCAVVETTDKVVVAKISQEKFVSKNAGTALHYEMAPGVDAVAVTSLGAALQPSCSPMGGLVSSGQI